MLGSVSKAVYNFQELAGPIDLSANVTPRLCRTEGAAHDQTVDPRRAGSVWLETVLISASDEKWQAP